MVQKDNFNGNNIIHIVKQSNFQFHKEGILLHKDTLRARQRYFVFHILVKVIGM